MGSKPRPNYTKKRMKLYETGKCKVCKKVLYWTEDDVKLALALLKGLGRTEKRYYHCPVREGYHTTKKG